MGSIVNCIYFPLDLIETTQGLRGKSDDSKRRLTTTSSESSVPSKRSAAEVVSEIGEEAEEADVSAPSPEPPHKKVTFLEVEFPSECGSDYADSNPSSTRSSLNSIDFRFIDHLVGPGTSSSRLTTNARLIIDQLDVSQLLMDARRSMIKKQSEITDVSDLLTINFIFDANFLKKHVPTNILTSFLSTPLPTPPDREMKLLLDCSVFAASHSFQETKRHIRNKIQTEGESLVTDILRHYTERPYLWQHSTSYPIPPPSLTQNEDTYTQAIVKNIILGVVGDLELSDHWSRDPDC
ncbi:hypothetical protein BC939DRAFT_277242 [Gamsiella multidivaricata]|uniref:uncharacterized protein n=1 Tax=Gamsiella multidivaricata TaxID=101098 RepID=UPI00221F1627|nr:uncharacterized protein BC939DRAFT_277242 [Gamsiella multidivaricata]KAI7818890.1 hypothetical protein BC939DRAFT_277242 [Gamsiella multidivaricata]